jgi:hypothetical protein
MSHIKYRSGNWQVATPIGGLRHESPLLPELNDVLIYHQDFVQLNDFWVAQDYNTQHPTLFPIAYLFNESPREDYGGNAVRWTQSWVRIPNSYGKAGGTYPVPFPGFDSLVARASRAAFKFPVAIEILRDFFLCGVGGAYPTWQDIPIIKGFRPYEINDLDPTDTSATTDTLSDPDPSSGDPGTSPSITAYKGLIAAGSIIDVEDSKVINFRGGVYMRERYTVKAL